MNSELVTAGFTLAGALVGALATYNLGYRKIQAEHIVKERAVWREKIRFAMASVVEKPSLANRKALWLTLSLNTNPFDPKDLCLVERAENLMNQFDRDNFKELVVDVTLLLKHDWDRAKGELKLFDVPPLRMRYQDYKNWLNRRKCRCLDQPQ